MRIAKQKSLGQLLFSSFWEAPHVSPQKDGLEKDWERKKVWTSQENTAEPRRDCSAWQSSRQPHSERPLLYCPVPLFSFLISPSCPPVSICPHNLPFSQANKNVRVYDILYKWKIPLEIKPHLEVLEISPGSYGQKKAPDTPFTNQLIPNASSVW